MIHGKAKEQRIGCIINIINLGGEYWKMMGYVMDDMIFGV